MRYLLRHPTHPILMWANDLATPKLIFFFSILKFTLSDGDFDTPSLHREEYTCEHIYRQVLCKTLKFLCPNKKKYSRKKTLSRLYGKSPPFHFLSIVF